MLHNSPFLSLNKPPPLLNSQQKSSQVFDASTMQPRKQTFLEPVRVHLCKIKAAALDKGGPFLIFGNPSS